MALQVIIPTNPPFPIIAFPIPLPQYLFSFLPLFLSHLSNVLPYLLLFNQLSLIPLSYSSFVATSHTSPTPLILPLSPTSLFYSLSFTSLSHFASNSSPSYIASPPVFDLLNHPTYLSQFHLTTPFPIPPSPSYIPSSPPTPPLSSYFTLFIIPLPHHLSTFPASSYTPSPQSLYSLTQPSLTNK